MYISINKVIHTRISIRDRGPYSNSYEDIDFGGTVKGEYTISYPFGDPDTFIIKFSTLKELIDDIRSHYYEMYSYARPYGHSIGDLVLARITIRPFRKIGWHLIELIVDS